MSQRLLVQDIQNSRVPASLNVCPDDARFFDWLNEAEELLLNQGRWIGSVRECQFCVESGCLVFPRQVAAIEQASVCGKPIDIQPYGYEFTRLLATLRQCGGGCSTSNLACGQCSCGHLQMRIRAGEVCSFATTLGTNKLIRSYPGSGTDVGKAIIYQGRDINGVWKEEQVLLTLPFVDTVTVWGPGNPVSVIKAVTDARVLVYEYDTVTHLERALAEYEPGETRPSYRVSYIPGLTGAGGCIGCSANGDTTRKTITALASLQHVQLRSSGDWLILQNISAYKAAMIAVKAWEEGDVAKGDFYFYGTQSSGRNAKGVTRVVNRGGAIPLLQAELRKMSADRTNVYVYTDESDKFARMTMGMR